MSALTPIGPSLLMHPHCSAPLLASSLHTVLQPTSRTHNVDQKEHDDAVGRGGLEAGQDRLQAGDGDTESSTS